MLQAFDLRVGRLDTDKFDTKIRSLTKAEWQRMLEQVPEWLKKPENEVGGEE